MKPLPDKLYRVGLLRIYVKEHLDRYDGWRFAVEKSNAPSFVERGEQMWEDLTYMVYDQSFYDRIGSLIKSYVPEHIRCFFHPYKLKSRQNVKYAQYVIELLVSDCDKSNSIDRFKPYQIQDYFHRKLRYILKERDLWDRNLMMIEKGIRYKRNDDGMVSYYTKFGRSTKSKTANYTSKFREIESDNLDDGQKKMIYESISSIKEVEICL